MEFFEVIRTRRSIRKMKPDPIPESDLMKILEAIKWAPSWANTQCWEIIVVTDPEIKKKLQETLPPNNPAYNACGVAPVLLVGVAKRNTSGFYKGKVTTDKGDWYMFDMGIALEHAVLAAWDLGIGSVHVGLFDHKKAAEILEVPEGYEVVEIIPLGYPEVIPPAPKRREVEEFTHYNKFGRKEK